jgi:hypothetical protein
MGWLWRDLLIGWVLLFLLPKMLVIPVFLGMWRSMRATEELDELDRAWLEVPQPDPDGDGGSVHPWSLRRPPRPRRGGPGPIRRLFRREAAAARTPRARR